MDRFLSGCVRPSTEFVMQVSFLPPSRLVAGLCRGLSFNDRLMDVPSGNLGCIEKCKSDMSSCLGGCCALKNASGWLAVRLARFSCLAGPLDFCGPWLFGAGLFISGASYMGSPRWLCRIEKCGDLWYFALKNAPGLPAGRPG